MKKIMFIPSSNETNNFVARPEPSKFYIPDWYKNIKSEYRKAPIFSKEGRLFNTDLKMCMPFLDSFTSGYIQKTWCDIYIRKINDKEIEYNFASGPKIIGSRDNMHIKTFNEEFYPIEFFWLVEWIPKTPKNYSILITNPLNRLDLPFVTLSGIIDSDLFQHTPSGNLPFYIKKDFEGVIPAGTPMYQMIPIKRESWRSEFDEFSIKNLKKFMESRSVFWEFYKNKFWQKKNYL